MGTDGVASADAQKGIKDSTRQVISRIAVERVVVLSGIGLFAVMFGMGWMLYGELSWINATAQINGECAGPAFWVRVYDVKAAILLRILGITAGAAVMIAGTATSFISLKEQITASGGVPGATVRLASASPGIFGLLVGGIVVSFAISQSAKIGAYQEPSTDWCTRVSQHVTLQNTDRNVKPKEFQQPPPLDPPDKEKTP
jgi:hypothetical protein